MARKVNFNYEKRQKEMRKAKKKQEKADAKRARRESKDGDESQADSGTPELDPSDDPWASAEALAAEDAASVAKPKKFKKAEPPPEPGM